MPRKGCHRVATHSDVGEVPDVRDVCLAVEAAVGIIIGLY
jgi:hypothetical protein